MYKKFKILGLLFLALILTFTMTACDNGTQSSLNEIEKTGSLIVTSKDLQFSTQGNISPANVIENQFLNYKIKVKIVHDRTGREKSQVIDVSIDDLKNNTDENS